MPKKDKFPESPFRILDPSQRWAPSKEDLGEQAYEKLLPPLVHKIRIAVKEWRESSYRGASKTSKALLEHWFQREHFYTENDEQKQFRYYFAQREAVESVIYLYEIAEARDKYELMKFDSSGRVSTGMFPENWSRYIIKMATGTGKTKVASLLMAWCYFHKLYELSSSLSTNFLMIAPNIIVLDRLKKDFWGSKIFKQDPIIPENGFMDKDWEKDFQLTVHLQDTLQAFSPRGNLYLTNRHRIGERQDKIASFEDKNRSQYFMGKTPSPDADRSYNIDLGELLRGDKIKDLIVLNDEAQGVREENIWFQNIEDINNQMKLKYGNGLALQLGFTATPRDQEGSIFVQTICDYPLVEAIRQNILKMPVLPDQASRAKLSEKETDEYVQRYRDYIELGCEEWKKQYQELKTTNKIPKLFIMTTTIEQANKVGKYLEDTYPEFENAVLIIHTKRSGEISEVKSKQKELQVLRDAADDIDNPESPYRAIVSVLMLKEGWDVQTVNTIVGLRPFTAESNILPEQTIGRGVRKMFPLEAKEELSVIGTEHFMDFVRKLEKEGVEFGYRRMGAKAKSHNPIVIEPDKENKKKDLEKLDIKIPRLTPRIYKEYKRIEEIEIDNLKFKPIKIKQFSSKEQREIVFENIEGEESHRTVLYSTDLDYRNVVKFFTNSILRETRLFSGFDQLYPKVKCFIELKLFNQKIDLADANIITNLSRIEAKNTIIQTFRDAINKLTVTDKGGAEIKNYIKLRDVRPQVFSRQEYVSPKKSVFNKIVGDSQFELKFAAFLDECSDVISFAKNTYNIHFKIEYVGEDGNIHNYYPDFLVKKDRQKVYVVETKGREDLDDIRKVNRLIVWCQDANIAQDNAIYVPIYIKEEEWKKQKKNIKAFKDVIKLFKIEKEYATR